MEKALELLKVAGFLNGNDLPDSTPGDEYDFRSSGGRMIVPRYEATRGIMSVLTDNGIQYTFKSGIITLY